MTNIAALLGYSGVQFNTQSKQFQPVNRAAGRLRRSRLHVNKILPTIQNRLARLCKNPPKYDVKPESNDSEDKEAARLALQVLMALWDKLTLNEKRIGLYMWVQQCGHAWIKVCWDDQMGKPMVDPMSGEHGGFEGDVRVDIASAFEVFPNPYAKSQEDVLSSWLIQAQVRPLDYFKAHYPEKGRYVKEEDAWLLSVQYQQRINSISSFTGSQGSPSEMMKNAAIEITKYEARSKDYPQGRMITIANGVLLDDKPLPVGEIPFAQFSDILIGGKVYSEATVTHLRPVQEQFNETIRRRAEWLKKYLSGKYKAARGAGLAQESLNDGESEVVYFDPVPNSPNGPEAIQVPMIPQWAYTEEDRLDKQFQEISGMPDVTQGVSPSANTPGIGMQLLVEQADSRIGITTEQHEHAWSRVGSLMLKYVERYYELPRKLKIAGRALGYAVQNVAGADLRGNTDVYVVRNSTIPGSKALRNQDILNRLDRGLLGNPQDPKVLERVNAMTEFGDNVEIFEDYGLDMSQIRKGIDKMKRGTPVEVTDWDNHVLWAQEINRLRKGDEWEKLDPKIQDLLLQNMTTHLEALMPPPTPKEPIPGENGEPPMPGADPNTQPVNPDQPNPLMTPPAEGMMQ